MEISDVGILKKILLDWRYDQPILEEDFTWLEIWPAHIGRRFYLTGDMTSPYPFIQDLLEWPLSELFFANISLWDQYKYIAFTNFTCRILIISYKMLSITGISNEKTNALTMYGILCQNITIFYRQVLGSLFQVQKKLKACRNSKFNFSNSYFIADDTQWCKNCITTCSSFQRTWYFAFLR